jgi:hypothetical protein
MAYLLLLPLIVYAVGDTFSMPLNLGPGLSLRNAVVYVVLLLVALRTAVRGNFKLELPAIHVCFAALIGYATLTFLAAALVIQYEAYDVLQSAIALKIYMIDYAIIFALFFYGTRTIRDGIFLTNALVIIVAIANVLCIASVEGIVNIGGVAATPSEDGRVHGAFGHANETGALLVTLLPAAVAMARTGGLFSVLAAIGSGMASLMMLLMGASRGAYVAAFLAYPWSAYLFRRYIPLRRALLWVGALVLLGAIALAIAGPQFIELLVKRLVEESSASDVGSLSSGRSGIWGRAILKMLSVPITLLTGFGWNSYPTFGFFYVPHNHYLLIYFELGLVGLLALLLLLTRTLTTVRSAVEFADPKTRDYLIAFFFGFSACLIALFFALLYKPWIYIWAYIGVTLRMAVCVLKARVRARREAPSGQPVRSRRRASAEVPAAPAGASARTRAALARQHQQ